MRGTRRLLLCSAFLPMMVALAACGPGKVEPPSPERAPDAGVAALATPTGPGSLAPDLVSGADGRLYLSWVEPAGDGHALRFAIWTEDGWGEAVTAASGPGWFVNWADTAGLAVLEDGTLAAHWLERSGGETYAYDVVLSVSSDGGATWSAPVRPHDDGTPTEHGFVSLEPGREGFDVAWLDGRRMVEDPPGPMELRHAVLGRNGAVGESTVVDPRVCECCPTAAARDREGRLLLAWRDRSDDEIRDIHISALSETGFGPAGPIHEDGWRTAGCPVNGPALAAESGRLVAAWFTMADERQGMVLASLALDDGVPLGTAAPIRLDGGNPIGRVDAAWLDDGALVSWIEASEGGAEFVVRRIRLDGSLDAPRRIAATSVTRASGYPRIARHDGRTFAAWTETGDTTRVRTAVID